MATLWTCPYCNRDCTLGNTDVIEYVLSKKISDEHGSFKIYTRVIVCPNPRCRETIIDFFIYQTDEYGNYKEKPIHYWHLKPESEAKPFPEYIPAQLRKDYEEACLIKTKSPKASATLSRRCLQGMIRDYWGITEKRLVDEINKLESKVDSATWKAIDSVRHVGNIGAHMEKDVNLIIDVDPEEAGMLIWLIETLFEEWYIAKHDKEEKMQALLKLAEEKKEMKKGSGEVTEE